MELRGREDEFIILIIIKKQNPELRQGKADGKKTHNAMFHFFSIK